MIQVLSLIHISDMYATAVDYSLDSQTTKDFFATVQNKMHYAVHGLSLIHIWFYCR